MKKLHKTIMLLIFWIILLFIAYKFGLHSAYFNKLSVIAESNPILIRCLFVLLSTIRIVFLIPQTIFIIYGNMLFGPYEGFILSMLSLVISQSIMYAMGRVIENQFCGTFLERNKEKIVIIKNESYKILALGIICPIIPSDLMTMSAAFIKLSYKKCVAVIAIAGAPIVLLYNFLGTRLITNIAFKSYTTITITFLSYYIFCLWNKSKNLKNC
ncbi:hypothetical protein NL50_08510 [Clostridium acetobutylicum]|nr:hypothetical protein NL50_08510 [Clostridium acetobutylicum]